MICDLDDVLLSPATYHRWTKRCIAVQRENLPRLPGIEFFVLLPDGRGRIACECPEHCTLFVEVPPGEWRWAAGKFN